MAGAGVPVSMDDGAGIAAAPEKVCPLPGVARSGQKWPLKGRAQLVWAVRVRRERVFFLGVGLPTGNC